MGTDKLGNIALTFNPDIGSSGAIALSDNLKKFLKRKSLLIQLTLVVFL